MKTINWVALVAFSILAVIALVVSIYSGTIEHFVISCVCAFVAYIAYLDIKNPQYP
jgi:hypothetical protein